ncbi:MAG: hypothetical protein ACRENZ_00340 [Thermodesulfobacteriota bacterium]
MNGWVHPTENIAQVGMYLMNRLCDPTLNDVAEQFGVDNYCVVGWACHKVQLKKETDRTFGTKLREILARISQQKI